ncbi:Cof-type HAD-IIB family hydrolase [Lacticaseibacillus parakribbianus]|uniref:Cof-type HAD-IIB family hydrolase n=1 Tax=Lacticaseibacillus parakribbianus TaxID=2970927 RepID=UPI0021CB5B8E|nr:Cof-type HAD-IIB family hydrolase [Lacticaseibacillus parakribbianus]
MTQALVFFDLDYTLLDDAKRVPAANLAAIAALQANDCLPILCTGKNYWEVADLVAQTGIDTLVCANGADLYVKGEHVTQQPIGRPQLRRLLAAADAASVPVALFNDHTVVVNRATAATQREFEMMRQPQPAVVPAFFEHEPVCMCLLFVPNQPDQQALTRDFTAAFPELTFYRNGPFALDVVANGMTKGTGIALLQARPDFAGVKTFAFGDGNNDLPMFAQVDVAVAMGNALPNVLAAADYITADYLHAGIPKVLRHFGLI